MEPGEPAHVRDRRKEITRAKSAEELATLYREMLEKHLLSSPEEKTRHDTRKKQASRESVDRTSSGGLVMGAGGVPVSSVPNSRRGSHSSQLHEVVFEEMEIDFSDGNGDPKGDSRGKWHANGTDRGSGLSTENKTKSSRVGKENEIVYTDITHDQLREDGFEIFNFKDGTVYAEVQFDHRVSNISKLLVF